MQVVVTGATGFVGAALCAELVTRGARVYAASRDPSRARARLGPEVRCVAHRGAELEAALANADAVCNLAGEPIFDKRWTAARKAELRASRVETTAQLVAALRQRAAPLPVLVSASATGYYGDADDALCDEGRAPGTDFPAELCSAWESAARAAAPHASRVVLARFGMILGPGGGALAAMLPVFRAGLGGRLGAGRQWVPWIHLTDAVAAIIAAVDQPLAGPVNVVSPTPVTSAELAAELGRALGRSAWLPAPALALRLALGERATMLLGGQRAVPAALLGADFAYRYPALREALAHAVA